MKKNRISKDEKMNFFLKSMMAFLFVLGASIFFYPFVVDALNNYIDQQRISYYIEKNETVNKEQLAARAKEMEKKNQQATNEWRVPGMRNVKDPFDTIQDHAQKPKNKEYQAHAIGAIFIPAISVSLPLFDTTNDSLLAVGATVLQGTSFPVGGNNTHSVITGHSGLPDKTLFTHLSNLKKGQMIYLHVSGKKLAYKIVSFKVVKPDQLDDIQIVPGKDLLTLVTCTPYMINTDRLLVLAERTQYREDEMKQAIGKTQNYHRKKLVEIFVGVALFFSAFFYWVGRKVWLLLAQCRNYEAVFFLEKEGQPVVDKELYLLYGRWIKKEVNNEGKRYVVRSDESGKVSISGVPGNNYRVVFVEDDSIWPKIELRLKKIHGTHLWVKTKKKSSHIEGKGLTSRIVIIHPK